MGGNGVEWAPPATSHAALGSVVSKRDMSGDVGTAGPKRFDML